MQLADLNPATIVAAAILSICMSGLLALLPFAPRRNCFFLRWHLEIRFLALVAAPFLIILWPLVLLFWLMRPGVIPADPDFYDD